MDTKQKINQKCYPAHIRPFCPEMGAVQTIQTVEQHCRNTAAYAQRALEPLGLGRTGYLTGLIHDAGKFTEAFRDYLTRSAHGEAVHRGSVNHTFAGVQLLLNQYHSRDGKNGDADWVSELLSVAVGSHHGLFDCVDEQGKNGFAYRKNKTDNGYEEAMEHFLQNCADIQELDALFAESVEENSPLLDRIGSIAKDEEEMYFYGGLLARMLLSAVIDGDRRDTAEFMNGTEFPVQRDETACKKMWEDCPHHAEEKISRFPQNTEIAKARMQISEQCRAFAEHPGGIYRLNVPTGGGKTLSSLRYALAHAAKWGKKHIIFTSPLLSILEQNAAVIREYVGNDSLILEHHSNVIQSEETELLDNRELLTETYDMPIIVTTLVQLLNTLFSGKTTAIRRFHALCESVIVIDEVQTVPNHMLSLFTLAVNFLTRIGGATVILCSATQPCMEDIDHPLLEDDHNILDMVPYHPEIWAAFRRTEIQDVGSLNLDGIAAFARSILGEANSLLIICNKKQQAQELFQNLRELDGARYHLSAGMCIAHRRAVLEEIRGSLEKGMPTVCVSTQLIEAGVDISFARVLRLSAGMDSVVHGRAMQPQRRSKGNCTGLSGAV